MVSLSGSKSKFAAFGPDPQRGLSVLLPGRPQSKVGCGSPGPGESKSCGVWSGAGRGHRAGLAIRFRGSEAPEDKWSNHAPREPSQKMTW